MMQFLWRLKTHNSLFD